MAEIVIARPNRPQVGAFIFDETPSHLHATRTVAGLNLTIPAKMWLKSAPRDRPRLVLNNIRLTFSLKDTSSELELGRLHHDRFFSAFVSDEPLASESTVPADLIWPATLQALISIERSRGGKQPKLHVTLHAELCYSIICEQWQDHVRTPRERFPVLTEPEHIFGQTDITYPTDVWEEMVQRVLAASQDDPFLMLLPLTSFLTGKKP